EGAGRGPVGGAGVREPQQQPTVGDEPIGLAAAGAKRAGRLAEDVAAGSVELAQAAEAGRERDLGHAQIRVVEQPSREVDTGRAGEPVGRHAEMRAEQAAEVSRRDAEPRRELALAPPVESAVE